MTEGGKDVPANLTPQYYEAKENFKKAATVEEKIAAIEEMLAVIPKHKGTEAKGKQRKQRGRSFCFLCFLNNC